MRRFAPYILVLLLVAALAGIKNCNVTTGNNRTTHPHNSSVQSDGNFVRRVDELRYSHHALCRMDCRHITKTEVEDIMQNGEINYNKSDLQNARCPRYALEGVDKDNAKVRIIFAQCDGYTEVVTVIDLDHEWACDCPGDEEKNKNRN
jgi:hypothetical protein